MSFITYDDDEVRVFHGYFENAGNEILTEKNLTQAYEWVHHYRTPGNKLVPDYVLSERGTNRWVLCVEIKRTPGAVYSNRNQIQAQGYVVQNANKFKVGSPRFFATSNLEQTILFCQRDGQPPTNCRIQNGKFEAGSFATSPEPDFRRNLKVNLTQMLDIVLSNAMPQFDVVWPQIIEDYVSYASSSMIAPTVNDGGNSPNWDVVKGFFCEPPEKERRLVFLLRCLLADYIRGILENSGHPNSSNLVSLTRESVNGLPNRLAVIFDRIRSIDFVRLYTVQDVQGFRNLSDRTTKILLKQYVEKIIDANIYQQARSRLDTRDLVDGMLSKTYPDIDLADRGKIRTDPEVAELLAAVAITRPICKVVDPCCGDGILLDAAYDRIRAEGTTHDLAIQSISGYECDALLARLAFIRLALKEPARIGPSMDVSIVCENMFDQPRTDANVILMNPPYLRYERMRVQVPDELKEHYADRIRAISGSSSIATSGQQNLFTYYVEYAIGMAQEDCVLAFVLDNKWYHNQYGQKLKEFILSKCEVISLIEYPYQYLFEQRQIATSIVVCRKKSRIPNDHEVRFIRIRDDLSNLQMQDIQNAMTSSEFQNSTLSCRVVKQRNLDPTKGWKTFFGNSLRLDYTIGLPKLPLLFNFSRRGSLQKEEGGMGGLAFPWSDSSYGRDLTIQQDRDLHVLALNMPDRFKGYAIKNSDTPENFVLTESDVLKEPTIEMDWQRGRLEFRRSRKTPNIVDGQRTLQAISADPAANGFVQRYVCLKGLGNMPLEKLWYGLREPVAGELIIPRKQRVGHKVFVNPYAFTPSNRQVRLSSNFISYSGVRTSNDMSVEDATKIIAAFLLSSFGELQFEMEGYNREGCLSVEDEHLTKLGIIDPSTIDTGDRAAILDVFFRLPFPIPTNQSPDSVGERVELDKIFARILASRNGWNPDTLIAEVHALLEEYLEARRR